VKRGLLPFLAVVASVAVAPLARAFFQVPDEPSPATGTAQVVAQGVVAIPNGDLRWEIRERNAPPPANAAAMTSGLGFLVVTQEVLLVEDSDTGVQIRVPAGEAMLAHPGTIQTRVALGSQHAVYDELALVATTEPAQEGTARYSSEPFAGSGARHDLDLLQDELAPSAQMIVPGGALPSLLLVREGGAQVTTETGDVFSLGRGEAVSLDGQLTVTATESGAGVAATYAGPTVPSLGQLGTPPAAPAGTPTAAAERVIEPAGGTATVAAGQASASTPVPEAQGAQPDQDGDGLSDAREAELGTDPTLVDTDGDGLGDGREVLEVGTDPLSPDTDGDGVLDGDEVAQGTNPLDAPGAGTSETIVATGAEEQGVSEVPAAVEAATTPGDSDGDGLEDTIEYELGTDPFDIDTDVDGLTDGEEYYVYQTGTRNPDSDGDGYLDGDEVYVYGTDPNDPASNP
jgi:hypothetical protein